MAHENVREAVGVFGDMKSMRAAADELMISGFDRADLSLLKRQKEVEQRLGHSYDNVSELEDDPDVPTRAYIGTDSLTEAKAAIVGIPCFIGAVATGATVTASGGSDTRNRSLVPASWASAAPVSAASSPGLWRIARETIWANSLSMAESCCGCVPSTSSTKRGLAKSSNGPTRPTYTCTIIPSANEPAGVFESKGIRVYWQVGSD